MFNDQSANTISIKAGQAFVYQTSAAVYASPSSDAEVMARLAEAAPVEIVPDTEGAHKGWLLARMFPGQTGFLRDNTKLITREMLLSERASIERGTKLGRQKVFSGIGIFLGGIAASIAFTLLSQSDKRGGVVYIFYGAVIVGIGQFAWGVDQISNSRHTLKKFDLLWQAVLA